MTINISLNVSIELEPADLVALGNSLTALWISSLATPPAAPPLQPPTATPTPKARRIEPTAQNGPETPQNARSSTNTLASEETLEIAAIPPATEAKDEGGRMKAEGKAAKQPRSGERLPFAEFDTLVGKELKRLSVDGRIPTAGLWDAERDQRLPTYAAVMARYGCTNLASFAEKMGMQPPLSKAFTINHNGANAIHNKEAAHATAA